MQEEVSNDDRDRHRYYSPKHKYFNTYQHGNTCQDSGVICRLLELIYLRTLLTLDLLLKLPPKTYAYYLKQVQGLRWDPLFDQTLRVELSM